MNFLFFSTYIFWSQLKISWILFSSKRIYKGLTFTFNHLFLQNLQVQKFESTSFLLNLANICSKLLERKSWYIKYKYTDIEGWLEMPHFLKESGSHCRYESGIHFCLLIRFTHIFQSIKYCRPRKNTLLKLNWESQKSAELK